VAVAMLLTACNKANAPASLLVSVPSLIAHINTPSLATKRAASHEFNIEISTHMILQVRAPWLRLT
jgi:hypothetical protein